MKRNIVIFSTYRALLILGLLFFTSGFNPGPLVGSPSRERHVITSTRATQPNLASPDWQSENVPYLGMTFTYPSNWDLQPTSYMNFGFRISSPGISVDPLGRPLVGGFLGAEAATSSDTDWNQFIAQSPAEPTVILGYPGLKLSGLESSMFKYIEWHFFAYNRHYVLRFVSSLDSFDSLSSIADEIVSKIELTGTYAPEPMPESVKSLMREVWSNKAILHAFSYGPGKIINDYNASSHVGALDYGLDICGGANCSSSLYNDIVYAPTDIKLVLNTNGYGMPSSSQDYHLFEVTYDLGGRLCLAMGHFSITISSFTVGKTMPRQGEIGRIISYTPSINHIHMNLYSVPLSQGCEGPNRVAVPFDSSRTDLGGQSLDGVDYHIGTSYVGAAVTSHLYGACALPYSSSTNGFASSDNLLNADVNGCDGGGLPSDNAKFITDVTIPDNTTLGPGQAFTKTWRMINNGATTWGGGYSWVFTGGDQMSAPSGVSVPTTSPNNTADLSVNMVAPASAGSYTGYWQLKNPQGQLFGDPVWVKINVSGSTSGQWHVEYFNSKDLNNRCYDSYENSTYILKNWGSGGPAGGCNSDNFSARFTRTFDFPGGSYSFHCQHDDGCRIFIDGQLRGDWWWDSPFTGHDWGDTLSGAHEVRIEFYDSGGDARLEAFWSGTGFLPTGPSCNTTEWCTSYYGNKDLSGTPAIHRSEGNSDINHDWGNGGVGYGFPEDNFSVRWQRNLYFPAGRYRFHIRVDDGGRLWVNNSNVIDQWKDQGATEYTTDLDLSSRTIPIRFEYYESGGGAVAQMWWEVLQLYSGDVDTTGVFRPSNGALYLKNSNSTGYADVAINYGIPGDKPVVGDWDGDGVATIGVYRNGVFYLRNSNTVGIADVYFAFGAPGDQPVAGDWDGDGKDTIGVYRSSNFTFYLRNDNSSGLPDLSFSLGIPGDVGIAGDWNGDGKDTTGVFRPSNGVIFLKNNNTTGSADIALNYGIPGDKPVTGDWDNDGIDTIGVYRNGIFYLRNSNTVGNADLYFALGIPGDLPIAGNWDGKP